MHELTNHAGFTLKESVKNFLIEHDYVIHDVGVYEKDQTVRLI
jgi:ribose 5-phosphate isomerase RpiB